MRIKFRIILLALPLTLASCSDVSDPDTRPATGTISVSVGSGPKIDIETEAKSRTELGEDGVSVKWASDDQIALWAVNSRSEKVLDKQVFKLYHYNSDYNTAKFTGDITPMPQDTYTYYAVSPVPGMSNGTEATYQIPAVQNGVFNGAWDVMVAEPVEAPALEQNDAGETVQFQFRHKVHVLKIRIPKNDLGEKVSEITLTFPQPVAGYMTVNAADPDAAPTLTSGSSTLTLRFDEPKDVDDVVFAVIAPIELTAAQTVTITAIGQSGESEPKEIAGKNFAAGHTTPIAYNVPPIGTYYTRLSFSLPEDKGAATLGETVEKITLTAPEGSLFDNGSNVREFTPDADGKYTIVLKPSWTDNLSGQAVKVEYESQNAIVSNTVTIPKIIEFENNAIPALNVPYLLEENFDAAANQGRTESTDELKDKGLPGWAASRYRIESGRASCFIYVGSSVGIDIKNGRLDSPFLPLKEGASVSIKVSYEIGCPTVGGTLSSKWAATCEFGTQKDTEGGISGNNGMSAVANSFIPANGGGFTGDLPQSLTESITGADASTRLCWRAAGYNKVSGSGWSVLTAKDIFIYLDNIKVSISNE